MVKDGVTVNIMQEPAIIIYLHLLASIGVCFPRLPAVFGEQPVAAVDIEVVDLTDDGSVENQLARITLLPVRRAACPLLYHSLDAAATECVATLDGDDRFSEDLAAHGAQEGLRLLHKLGRLVGCRHAIMSVRCRSVAKFKG